MHTDERLSMFTHSPSMTKVTSTPTLATTGTKQTIINGSTYLGANGRISLAISSMLEASVSILLNVSGMQTHRRITYSATASLIPPSNAVPNHTIHAQLSNRGPSRKHRKQHNHLRICRSPNSNNDDSADGWKHHHQHLNHQP